MENTRFTDPEGIGETNVSTAKDLLSLVDYIYEKRQFLFRITKGESYLAFGPTKLSDLKNYNDYFDNPDLIGSKIGETIAAKTTSIVVWNFRTPEGRVPVAMIVLGADDHRADEALILAWLKENYVIETEF